MQPQRPAPYKIRREDNVDIVDMRAGAKAPRAGAIRQDDYDVQTEWHKHDMHQLLYAFEGHVQLETAAAHFLLPPQQAAFIPAGLVHRTTLRKVKSGSVFFEPALVGDIEARVRILGATPIMREMIIYAMRWPIGEPVNDPAAQPYFEALGLLCREWIETELPLSLPTARDPTILRAMDYTRANVAGATLTQASRAAGLSERSLRRRFQAEAGMSWQRYRQQCRLLQAMALLGETPRSITQIAAEVGFESQSAFAKAFAKLTGETPRFYRKRLGAE